MRLGPAPTTSSRHQPRTAHNAAAPRPTLPPHHTRGRRRAHHPKPPSPPPSILGTQQRPRKDHHRPRRRAAGRQAGTQAGRRANRTRLAAHGGRRSAVGGRRSARRHTDEAAAGQAVPANRTRCRVAQVAGSRQSAAWRPAAGGLRQRKRPRNGLWGRSPSNALQPPPTPPTPNVPPPVPRETGKRPRGNSAKTQTEGSWAVGRAATTPTPVSPKRFFKNEKMARALGPIAMNRPQMIPSSVDAVSREAFMKGAEF